MIRFIYLIGFLIVPFIAVNAQPPSPAPAQDKPILLVGGTVHVGNGEVIKDAVVVMEEGRIEEIGTEGETQYNKESFVYDVTGKQIYPGLILPASTLGLVEIGSVRATVDTRETGTLNPNVRSIVAYDSDSRLIPTIRSNGVMLAQVVPGGGQISGTSSIVQLDAWDWEDAAVRMDNGMHMRWPRKFHHKGEGRISKNPEYEKQVKSIRALFEDARVYSRGPKQHKGNLKLEALKGLLDGSMHLYIDASSPETIIESVNFAREYGIDNIVLTGAGEEAWKVKDFLKKHDVAVILSEIHSLPAESHYDIWEPCKLPAKFYHAGIKVGLSVSWLPRSMNYPFLAGTAAAFGLDKEEALQLITKMPAEILGIDDIAGTLEEGKDATLIVSEGDILDMTTNQVTRAFIRGREIDLDNRHKKLYRKYKGRYDQQPPK
jgi:imidazolonepropionase-like amidohydrolase